MTKTRSRFVCQECRYEVAKWMGKCSSCNSWNTFEEKQNGLKNKQEKPVISVQKISEVHEVNFERFITGMNEFDRVMGGGITRGSLTLLGGEPGVGKSTLLIDISGKLSRLYHKEKILYVSGEESLGQIAARSRRLEVSDSNIFLLNETNWQNIIEALKKEKAKFLILDSIQTTISSEVNSLAGSVSQIKEVTFELMNYAKANDITCFIVGHINKEGTIAGPKILEHMVDTVIHFEGDKNRCSRVLRVFKNRFGSTDEVGLFKMTAKGLEEGDIGKNLINDDIDKNTFGRSLTAIYEGNRSIFTEVQALVSENKFSTNKITTQGYDPKRLSLLIAIIDKYFDVPISLNDIYINIVGEIKMNSREGDLSVIASLLSSLYEKTISTETIFWGEVGLCGEVRAVSKINSRIKELAQLGFKKIVLGRTNIKNIENEYGLNIVGISRACELKQVLMV